MLDSKELVYMYEELITGKRKHITGEIFYDKDSSEESTSLALIQWVIENMLRWTPEDAYNYWSLDLMKQLSIDFLIKHIDFPPEFSPQLDTNYIVAKIYPGIWSFDKKERALIMYKRLLTGEAKKVPGNFFDGHIGRIRAFWCLRYAITDSCMFSDAKSLYEFFASKKVMEFLKKYKLHNVYNLFFEDPIDYLHFSFSEETQITYKSLYDTYRKDVESSKAEIDLSAVEKKAAELEVAGQINIDIEDADSYEEVFFTVESD